MKRYLIDKLFRVRSKNKLQREICNVAEGYDRVVINENEFEDTYRAICKQVDELNLNNPRCRAERVDFYSNGNDKSITVGSADSFVRLSFLQFEDK